MDRDNVTFFAGVPTMYWAMLNYPKADKYDLEKIAREHDHGRLRRLGLPVEVLKDFGEKFSVKILEGYGLSETSPVANFNRTDLPTKPGSVGPAVWGVDVRVVDFNDEDVPPARWAKCSSAATIS